MAWTGFGDMSKWVVKPQIVYKILKKASKYDIALKDYIFSYKIVISIHFLEKHNKFTRS